MVKQAVEAISPIREPKNYQQKQLLKFSLKRKKKYSNFHKLKFSELTNAHTR